MATSRRIHLDPIGGIAGDMFVAAVTAAFPSLRAPLLAQLEALDLSGSVEARFEAHTDCTLAGSRFMVELRNPAHGAGDHGHVRHSRIAQWLARWPLREPVRSRALAIFGALATAEAAVHGVPIDEVEFHEVGAWDSIVDIVSAAFLIDALGPASWSLGPLPLGSGVVATSHGTFPVPAPATLHLLRGLEVVDDGVGGERVTPTGAAIVRHLVDSGDTVRAVDGRPLRVGATGFGFGSRRLPGRPNALRCTEYLESGAGPLPDFVQCLVFDVDDQTAEDLATGLDRLRTRAEVLQVTQMPVYGKKGRLATRVEVLALDGAGDELAHACFRETTTIGLRKQRIERSTLERRGAVVELASDRSVRVKRCERGGTTTSKVEIEDLAALDGGHEARERARRRAAQVLENAPTNDQAHRSDSDGTG